MWSTTLQTEIWHIFLKVKVKSFHKISISWTLGWQFHRLHPATSTGFLLCVNEGTDSWPLLDYWWTHMHLSSLPTWTECSLIKVFETNTEPRWAPKPDMGLNVLLVFFNLIWMDTCKYTDSCKRILSQRANTKYCVPSSMAELGPQLRCPHSPMVVHLATVIVGSTVRSAKA